MIILNPENRSVAQPIPGQKVPEVKERAEASEEDKKKALDKNSQRGIQYSDDANSD
jgi:hypothetical protein